MIYSAFSKGPYKMKGFHDKDSKRLIGIIYRPDTWLPNTVYNIRSETDYDIVLPTVFNGLYFKVNNPGKSGATEPVWPTVVGDTIIAGATFEAVAYNLLPLSETITSSSWTASDGAILASPSFTADNTQVLISSVPVGVETFTITNHTIKSNAEEDDVTIKFRTSDR